MKRRLKWLVALLPPLVILVGCKEPVAQKEAIRPIKAMQIGKAGALAGRWFPGKARGADEADLSFRVSGTLAEFPVNVGDEVKKGDLLARLDPRDFQVALENAKAQLSKAQAALETSQAEYDRALDTRQRLAGAISEKEINVKKGLRDSAKAQLASAQAAVSAASDSLSYTELKAPFAGTVVEKFVENFEDAKVQQPVVRIVDTRQIEFVVQIPESMMANVAKVEKGFVVFDVYPGKEVPARISEIGKEASKTTRTYPVTLIMDQPKEFKILPGMAGKARADIESARNAVKDEGNAEQRIPLSATFADSAGKTFVWVVDDASKQVSKREVQTGSLTPDGILVKGLKPGEWIATAGVNTLVDGQKVRILP